MKNAVRRDSGRNSGDHRKRSISGNYYKDGTEFQKRGPITKVVMSHDTSKMVAHP
ncbi:MAG: hypothetical protein V8S22_01650 [Lachnospiraceae bacterium]